MDNSPHVHTLARADADRAWRARSHALYTPVCTHCRAPITVQPFTRNGHHYHPRSCAVDLLLKPRSEE